MNIFELAARAKLRFNTAKGLVTTEDLWDLPLTSGVGKANLDDIARDLHIQLKDGADVSFVNTPAKANTTLQLSFDVVKSIIDTKLAERSAASLAQANKDKKARLLEILDRKEGEALTQLSADELRAQIDAL